MRLNPQPKPAPATPQSVDTVVSIFFFVCLGIIALVALVVTTWQ